VAGRSVGVEDRAHSPDDSIGATGVYTWDAVAQRFVLASSVVPGGGYWIAAAEGCLLSIPSPA